MFTISCRVCGSELKTERIENVIAFDAKHAITCDGKTPDTLRDAGMKRAEEHADMLIIASIDAAIDRANASGQPWSANDIRDQFLTTKSKGLVGSRVRAAAARRPRVMEHTGRYVQSSLPGTHRAEIKVWVGVVAKERAA